MTSRTLFALALSLLLFAGCSGSDAVPEKAAVNQDDSAATAQQTSRSPENAATHPEQPTVQPSKNKPQESGMAQANSNPQGGELAQWLAPYLSDEVTDIVAIDLRRLGPLKPLLPQFPYLSTGLEPLLPRGAFLSEILFDEEQTIDIANIELIAVLADTGLLVYDIPHFTLVIRTSQPNPALQEALLERFYDLYRLCPDKVAELPAEGRALAPVSFADGRTMLVGPASIVDKAKRRSGYEPLGQWLKAQGDHAAIAHLTVPPSVKDGVPRALDIVGTDSEFAVQLRPTAMTRSLTISADIEPLLRANITILPEEAADIGELKPLVQKMQRDALERVKRLKESSENDSGSRLMEGTRRAFLEQGQWREEKNAIVFEWASTTELTQQLSTEVAEVQDWIQRERERRKRAARTQTLKWTQFRIAIYAEYHQRFPRNIVSADGKPLMSWRVELLPVMEQVVIYDQLRRDEPWDSPHNAAVLKQVSPRLYANNPDTPDGYADVQAVIGPGFGFSPADRDQRGEISIGQIIDGMVYTVMAVEVAPEKAVPWAKPDDYVWNPEKPTEGLGPKDKPYFLAVFGDARVQAVSKQESADTLKAAFGRADRTEYELMPVEGP